MKLKKKLHFLALFSLLAGFTAISIGMISPTGDLIKAVSAADSKDGYYLDCKQPTFDAKVLNFLEKEKVCALTKEQALEISKVYSYENKQFTVDGKDVNVLYLKSKCINKEDITDIVGDLDPDRCQVVKGNKLVAIISPIF